VRRLLYLAATRAAVLPWALGMLNLAVAFRLAVWADRISPSAIPPNCWVYAAQQWEREYLAWSAAGYPEGAEPYGVVRGSRKRPKWIPHALVGTRERESGLMDLVSFKPDDPEDAPVWAFWRRTEFKGRVHRGD
jgi:hypothetical protein